MYYGDSFADLATMRLEGKIKNIYAQAYREIEEKLNTFLAKSVIKEKEYEAKVQAGKLSQEWFDRWKSGQVFIGKRWRDLRQNIAHEIYNSRKSATDMINGERKAVFQDNVNYTQYSIDKDHNFGISFTLYDNATVTRLISEDPDLVPDIKYPDPNIDYAWSKKQITSAITQGILQGESIPELAKRVGKKLQSSNTASMVRCARTAMTGAQNSGRIEAMHNAQNMGIGVEKLWIATLDGRTRDSHRDLDGQLAKVDEPFHSLLGDIMFPGDPNATPANVWQCRCSLGWNYPKYSNQYDTRAARDVDWEDGGQTEQIPYMTYKEWAKWKKTGQLPQRGLAIIETQNNAEEQIKAVKENAPKRPAFEDYTKKLKASMDEQDYEAFKKNVENSETRILYEKYADECKAIIRTKNGGKYTPEDTVIYDYNSNSNGRHRYSTLAHEMGHMFDAHIKRGNSSLTFNETDLMNKSCNARITVCPSNSDQFLRAIRKDKTDSLSGILNNIKEKVKLLKYGDASGGVQDALDGFFSTQKNRQFKWGHGERYYNRNYNYVDKIGKSKDVQKAYSELGFGKLTKEEAKREFRIFDTAFETWANVISAITNGGDELKAFEEFMPETVKTAREIIKGIE